LISEGAELELSIRLTILLFATVLFGIAAFLFLKDQTAPAGAAMGFVLFFVFILTVSNYKRIKGLGFEAEMWGEKQEQAANLIDRLQLLIDRMELLGRLSSEHIVISASRPFALSNSQVMQVIETIRPVLAITKTSESERETVLSPLYDTIISNYIWFACNKVTAAVGTAGYRYNMSIRNLLSEQLKAIDKTLYDADSIAYTWIRNKTKSIQPLIDIIRRLPHFDEQEALLNELDETEKDMSFFVTNKRLRRGL
jgi:hypothetical protein